MKMKNSVIGILLSFAALHSADVPYVPVSASELETGAQIPPDNYYSSASLARLNAEGKRKHAPLAIIIDQANQENPYNDYGTLTGNLAHLLQTGFVPIMVSRSIAYDYFVRRKRAGKADFWFIPKNNPVSFNEWHLYDVPHSQFFLFVPDHYIKRYRNGLGFNLGNLIDVSTKLPTEHNYEAIIEYIESYKTTPPFSIDNLRTVLTTIEPTKPVSSGNDQLTKAELKAQGQLPIWDIILHGHGSRGDIIGGIPLEDAQALLVFFNNELPVGLFYMQTCSAGGENLNLLEFDTTINKEDVLRNLDYILIVGSITDKPSYTFWGGKTNALFYQLYSDAARLQGKGASLDTLLNNLNDLYRHSGSPHGSSNIPQVWLPGGLGFQTYQINEKVQIIGNVKTRVHEDEQRPIELPDSTRVTLMYAKSINVPLYVLPYEIHFLQNESRELDVRKKWKNIPNIAELLQQYFLPYYSKETVAQLLLSYPALNHILTQITDNGTLEEVRVAVSNAIRLLYPELISMLRGNNTVQYFSKIELQSPIGKENEMTGVMHFIRDAFFDIGERATTKIFLIEELVGNNDISALLELGRLKNNVVIPHPLEKKLTKSIGKQIRLQKVYIQTDKHYGYLGFIFNDQAWGFSFQPTKAGKCEPAYWNFQLLDAETLGRKFNSDKSKIKLESIGQIPISETLIRRAPGLPGPHR